MTPRDQPHGTPPQIEAELVAHRKGTVRSRLGDLLKAKNIKIADLRNKWDKDGSGKVWGQGDGGKGTGTGRDGVKNGIGKVRERIRSFPCDRLS